MKSSIKEYKTNKWERPFSEKHPLHVTMRSEIARGDLSLLTPENSRTVRDCIHRMADHFDIRLFHFAIESTHVHLVIFARSRAHLAGFLSAVSGMVARKILSTQKELQKGIRFWSSRPYSRILSWGCELRNVLNYVERNILEAKRVISYTDRNEALSIGLKRRIEESFRARAGQLGLPMMR